MTRKRKPVIGIILDWEASGSFSDFPYYALRHHYVDAVRLAGGNPWLIPYGDSDSARDYLEMIDGLLVPGGFYAMKDEWYEGQNTKSPYQNTPRLQFEITMIQQALDQDIPMLGICGGMQVLGGILGCKLTSDLKKTFNNKIEHFDLTKPHDIEIEENSLLYQITKSKIISTNSHHKEALISVSAKVKISAKTSDGIIEAIEIPDKKFALGLQWHPEMLCGEMQQITDSNPHHLIFKEFISRA
jgi:putative glutamine amidotransferase